MALDSRWKNRAAIGEFDPSVGSWSSFQRIDIPEPFNRRGFRGMTMVDDETVFAVNSAALYRLRRDTAAEGHAWAIEQTIRRPEWEVGQRAAADLHHVHYVRSRDVLLVANTHMDSLDEVTPAGELVERRYLWDLSSPIAQLALERRQELSIHDLAHLNHVVTHRDCTYLTLGNLNGTRLGCIMCAETGEIVLDDLHFPHDGMVVDDDLYVTSSDTSELLIWNAVGDMEIKGRTPDAALSIPIRQETWRESFQWVRGIAVTPDYIVVGVTQWRGSLPGRPQIPPRLVFFHRAQLEYAGEIFLPQLEDFPSPCIYSIHVLSDEPSNAIPAEVWDRAIKSPPPTESIKTPETTDEPQDLSLLLNHERRTTTQLKNELSGVGKELSGVGKELSSVQKRASRAEGELVKVRKRLAKLEEHHAVVQANYQAIRETRWHRLGLAIRDFRRNPRHAYRFAKAVARAIFRGRRPRRRPNDTGRFSKIDLPRVELTAGPRARPDLSVAVILDTFSSLAFRYEWYQIEPTPKNWRELLEDDRPDLLFVESAWWGNDSKWAGAMSRPTSPSRPLRELVSWCKANGIPTVFWNKEDPPNFDKFIGTARLFDYVFTVDADCLPRYRQLLGHDRVALLPFAAQPRIHNPMAVPGGRQYDVVYAGTYHAAKYPERREQMELILGPAREFGLHIFSRMMGDTRYAYPPQYADFIVGSLDYEQMLAAYKAYKVFLNVNTVTESETMCARRVFELSACATPVVSGFSAALEKQLNGLVSISRQAEDTTTALKELLSDSEFRDRRGHLAMRAVFAKHTYSHRVSDVLSAVGLPDMKTPDSVSIVLATNRPHQLDHAIAQVARQKHSPLQLVLVTHGFQREDIPRLAREAGLEDVEVRSADRSMTLGACLNIGIEAADGKFIAKMDDDNLYGADYLSDLMFSFAFAGAQIVGKGAHHVFLENSGRTLLRFDHLEHTRTRFIQGGTILGTRDALAALRFADIPRGVDTDLLKRARKRQLGIYSADRFNFVSVRSGRPDEHTWKIEDEDLERTGKVAIEGPPDDRIFF